MVGCRPVHLRGARELQRLPHLQGDLSKSLNLCVSELGLTIVQLHNGVVNTWHWDILIIQIDHLGISTSKFNPYSLPYPHIKIKGNCMTATLLSLSYLRHSNVISLHWYWGDLPRQGNGNLPWQRNGNLPG